MSGRAGRRQASAERCLEILAPLQDAPHQHAGRPISLADAVRGVARGLARLLGQAPTSDGGGA
jgi:hypothetical protein